MKKIAIVLFVAATALAGCGKKKAPAAPAGGDTGSAAAPAGDTTGSGDAAGSAAPDASAGSAGGGM
jgi:hypothetical protein